MNPTASTPARSRRREEADRLSCGHSPSLPEPAVPHCEGSCRDCGNTKRVRLPRPVRHERGEGRGEGCFTIANGPTLRSASSPQGSPPSRTEESKPEALVETARTFAMPDAGPIARNAPASGLPLPSMGRGNEGEGWSNPRRPFSPSLCLLLLLALTSIAHARINVTSLPGRDSIQLTIYNSADLLRNKLISS